jgi:hypothetical protein
MAVKDLRNSPTMQHLLEALERGEDIGHYGRLTFAMAAHHFMEKEALVKLLGKGGDTDESKARALVEQVVGREYNPPSRRRILEWQSRQEFPICPNPEDPNAGNLYRELEMPEEVYEDIQEFWEETAAAR